MTLSEFTASRRVDASSAPNENGEKRTNVLHALRGLTKMLGNQMAKLAPTTMTYDPDMKALDRAGEHNGDDEAMEAGLQTMYTVLVDATYNDVLGQMMAAAFSGPESSVNEDEFATLLGFRTASDMKSELIKRQFQNRKKTMLANFDKDLERDMFRAALAQDLGVRISKLEAA